MTNSTSMKKFLATATTAAIVASAVAPAALAAELTDIQDYEFKAEIDALVAEGIIGGYPDGTFQPYKEITRGEAAIMIARAKGLLTGKDIPANTFTDVNDKQASYEAVLKLADAGIVSGFGNDEFRPNEKITRAQMAKYIVNAYELTEGDGVTTFPDVNKDAALATFVDAVADAGIVSGYNNGDFGYGDPLKRGHFAKMVYKAETLKEDKEVKPAVEGVSVANLKEVTVTFTGDVDLKKVKDVKNYAIEDKNGNAITKVTDVEVVKSDVQADATDKTTVILTLEANLDSQSSATIVVDKAVTGEEFSKEVKFFDTTVPTADVAKVTGPKTVTVKFSEPLKEVPTFEVNDGQVSIVNNNFTAGVKEVQLVLGSTLAEDTHEVTVKGGKDYAGFAVEETTLEFDYVVDEEAPVATVQSATETEVVLEFNEDVVNANDANVKYYHTYKGTESYKATVTEVDGNEVTLSFAGTPLPQGQVKLFIAYENKDGKKIADAWGNELAETTLTATIKADVTAPTITNVEVKDNQNINVTYSEEVLGADKKANYTLTDSEGKAVSFNVVKNSAEDNTYTIKPASPLNGGTYTLAIKDVTDASINKNKLADYSTTLEVDDKIAPTVVGDEAVMVADNKVRVKFSEAMDKDSITNKENYSVTGVEIDTIQAVDGNKAVIITLKDEGKFTKSQTINLGRVKDAQGNSIEAFSTTLKVVETAEIVPTKAAVTGANTVVLTFDEVITGAKTSDFLVKVAADNAEGSVYEAPASINVAVEDGKSVITLTTNGVLANGTDDVATVEVKTVDAAGTAGATANAKNEYGTALNFNTETAAPAFVFEDKYAPTFINAVAKDSNSNNQVDSFVLTFSEALYIASVQEADFAIEGYDIKGVNVAGNKVTVTVKELQSSDLDATTTITLVGEVDDEVRNTLKGSKKVVAEKASAAK